jgi:hypothetical protein
MELHTMRADEVHKLAQRFRLRATEAEDAVYHRLMLRTAVELEELAGALSARNLSELVLVDEEERAV